MTLGPIVGGVGMLLFMRLGQGASYLTDVLPAVLVFGLGLSATVAPLTATVLDSVSERQVGIASGVNNGVSRVAGLLAIAVLGAVISAHFGGQLDSALGSRPLSPPATSAVAEAKEQPLGVPDVDEVDAVEAPRIIAASADASTSALHLGALLAGLLTIIGGIVAGIGIRNPRRPDSTPEDAEPAKKLDLATDG
jgi:hypothetical protein